MMIIIVDTVSRCRWAFFAAIEQVTERETAERDFEIENSIA